MYVSRQEEVLSQKHEVGLIQCYARAKEGATFQLRHAVFWKLPEVSRERHSRCAVCCGICWFVFATNSSMCWGAQGKYKVLSQPIQAICIWTARGFSEAAYVANSYVHLCVRPIMIFVSCWELVVWYMAHRAQGEHKVDTRCALSLHKESPQVSSTQACPVVWLLHDLLWNAGNKHIRSPCGKKGRPDNYKTTKRQLQDNYKTTIRQLIDNPLGARFSVFLHSLQENMILFLSLS